MTQEELAQVRDLIRTHKGEQVLLHANQGRRRFKTSKAIISAAYPNVFVVDVISENPVRNNRKMTFSYHDIATNDVRMSILS